MEFSLVLAGFGDVVAKQVAPNTVLGDFLTTLGWTAGATRVVMNDREVDPTRYTLKAGDVVALIPADPRLRCEFCGPGDCSGHVFPGTNVPLPDLLTPEEVAHVLRFESHGDPNAAIDRLVKSRRLRSMLMGNPRGGARRMFRRLDVLRLIYHGDSDPRNAEVLH